MFRNRSIEMKVVKTPKQNADALKQSRTRMTPEQIATIAKDGAKYVAVLAGAGYTLKKVVDAASDIAVHTATIKIK